jgi:hypothetical protein
MTPAALLAKLIREGASMVVVGDRLRVEAPTGVLTAAVRQALAVNKPAIVGLLRLADEYRAVLADTVMDEAAFREAQSRLIDEVGPELATAIHRVERALATGSGVGGSARNAQRPSTDGAACG